MSDLVTVETDGRVAIVTVNDPERRNALTLPMVTDMVEVFDRLDADESIGAVVVTGAAPAFCAGADLSHLGTSQRQGLLDIYEGFLRVARSPLPTIAAVNGAAVGAGMNLALCCDLRVAGRSAKFDTRFAQLGIHPGGGHTWMFRNVAGQQATMAAVLFGEVLDGEAAERAGLVWRCVPDDDLLDVAVAMAAKAAAGPRALMARIKSTVHTMGTVTDHPTAVATELEPQLWSIAQPEFAARLAALQQKISTPRP